MLYLASKSPRRQQLLEQIGVSFKIVEVDVAEVRAALESPQQYVTRVACDKAIAGCLQMHGQGVEDVVVLGADTEVVLDDEVFGKPVDAQHAAGMLRRLSGRTHRVLSAVWCVSVVRRECALSVSEVSLADLSDADIAAYVASGEFQGKAGAYAIQGRAAAFITHLSGSYSGVMGLPLRETAQMLHRFEGVLW
ncbi:MAG TPA: Maf family protein [Rudaea sp.]|nr:Maf family protein [Rudaea sp.]